MSEDYKPFVSVNTFSGDTYQNAEKFKEVRDELGKKLFLRLDQKLLLTERLQVHHMIWLITLSITVLEKLSALIASLQL